MINLLVDENIVYKKRGLGMFVSTGAAESIRRKRKKDFFDNYIDKVVTEAKKLGLTQEELAAMIERGYDR